MPRYLVERSFPQGLTIPIDDGPSPQAIRRAAQVNQLPIDRITEVRVLDPYFYR